MMKKEFLVVFLLLFLVLLPEQGMAQCAMCRAVLESGADQEAAKGLNDGIIYLMAVPYILIGAVGYAVYRKLK